MCWLLYCLCQPRGGKARLTEGCSFRQKQHWSALSQDERETIPTNKLWIQNKTTKKPYSAKCDTQQRWYIMDWNFTLIKTLRDFLGGPGAKTQAPNAWGVGLILGWGTKIQHATRCSKKKKKIFKKQNQVNSFSQKTEWHDLYKEPQYRSRLFKISWCVQILSLLCGPWLLALFPDTRFQMLLGLLHSRHLRRPTALCPASCMWSYRKRFHTSSLRRMSL